MAAAGAGLDDRALDQIFLPRFLCGFQIDDPVASLPRARIARVIERRPMLRRALHGIAPSASDNVICEAECIADGGHCLDLLRAHGVTNGACGILGRGRP